MITVRTVHESEIEEVAELSARVFGRPEEFDQLRGLSILALTSCPFMKPEHCWVASSKGRIVAKWQGLDFRLRIGAATVRAVGLQGVVAHPDVRGRGFAEAIAREFFASGGHREFDLLLGFAKRGAFFERLGGVPVMPEFWWTVPTRRVGRLDPDPFTPMQEEDLPALLDFYDRFSGSRPGSMVRTKEYWPWMIRKPDHILMHPDGYFGYRVLQGPLEDDRVELREIAGQGEAFHDAVIRKLGDVAREHGIETIGAHIPSDHPLVESSIARGSEIRVEYPAHSGGFAMIANFERLMQKLRPELALRLERSPWRDAHVQLDLRCGDAGSALTLGREEGDARKVALALAPPSFIQLVFGYRSVRSVLWDESIELDGTDVALLDALFPAGNPFMWHTDRF